jgi:hypothetical protein
VRISTLSVIFFFSVILYTAAGHSQGTSGSPSPMDSLRARDTNGIEKRIAIDSIEGIKKSERYFQNVIRNLSDQFGINGSIQNMITESTDDASLAVSLSFDSLPQSQIKLYPFQNYSVISVNPNENYLLAKGPILDFSQTQLFLPNYKINVKIDSTGNYYVFEDSYGSDVSQKSSSLKQAVYITREEYFKVNFKNQTRNMFSKTVVARLTAKEETTSGAIRLFSASVTTNETFQKIFGGDEVTVDATGNINLNVSGAKENTSNQNVNTGKSSQFTPKFEQKQKFNLRGTIGRKVEILFDQDSDREFDFENNIKLTYTGYDDEILQKLEAGNIDLSLPATEFVTTGGQNKGLFGVKAVFKLANLNLTAIASIQRGEKTKLSLKGGGQPIPISMGAWQYAKAKFFFLDFFYRDNFENYQQRIHSFVAQKQIDKIKVYRYTPGNERIAGSVPGIAYLNPSYPQSDPKPENGFFIEQKLGENYTIDSRLGIITMTSPLAQQPGGLSTGEILAVAYQTHDGISVGNVDSDTLRLKKIWGANPVPPNSLDSTWNLELKNIYDLGVKGLSYDDAKTLKITYTIPSKPPVASIKDNTGKDKGIMEILHIDETSQNGNPDNIVDDWSQVGYGLNYADGYLIFPRLQPFDPPSNNLNGFEPESFPDSIDAQNPVRFRIYNSERGLQSINSITQGNRLIIQMTTNKKSSNISLGINVLEGSEEILLNGEKLEKDIGYNIDYFSGNIELLDPRAVQPNANIDVSYEQAQLFQVEKRSIFGARAEYGLADLGFSQNSFIGTTALFNSQSTINKRVQLGEEPFSNFVWDINTNLEFNARFLTKAVNFIPFVSSTQASKINIRAEYAKIFPNPNTSNGLMKANENGVAYIDDFEAIKRTFPLGNSRKGWLLSSVPLNRSAKNRGYGIWYQRAEPRSNISKLSTTQTDVVTTLGLAFQPKKDAFGNTLNSWAGIARGFSESAAKELAETRFIELWVKNTTYKKAKITIELGLLSEDQNENKIPDREIKSGLQIGIDPKLDVGLDGLNDQQEADTLARVFSSYGHSYDPNVKYDNLNIEQKKIIDSLQVIYPWGLIGRDPSDPFGDDWSREDASPQNNNIEKAIKAGDISKVKPNGLENNLDDGATRVGDLEDLSGYGRFSLSNSYLSYSFSTDSNSKDAQLIVGWGEDKNGLKNGWYLYRIPILSPDTIINSENVQKVLENGIKDARVWISPLENSDSIIAIQIAEFQLVTSEWTFPREHANGIILNKLGKVPSNEDVTKIVEISSINTEENSTYQKPKNVQDEYVASTNGSSQQRQVKEQSLNLKLNELPPSTTAIIVKNFTIQSDFRNYGNLRLFVHGDKNGINGVSLPIENASTVQSPITFFFRFGADSNNYYEIREPLFADWAESRNSVDINFQDLTAKKFDSSVRPDSANVKSFYVGNGKLIRIKGNPSLGAISQLYIGAINNGELRSYTGEIWVDELRLTNANDKTGEAAKAFIGFNLADLASFNGSIQYQTAEWRSVDGNRTEGRFSSANSANTRSWGLNGSVSLHKFYLERWGISLPFSFNINNTTSDPKYLPGNDILVATAKAQNSQNIVALQNTLTVINDSIRYLINTSNPDPDYLKQLSHQKAQVDSELTSAENFDSRITSQSTSKGYNLRFSKAKNDNDFWLIRYTIDNVSSDFNYTIVKQQNPQIQKRADKNWASATSYNLGIKKKSVKPLSWLPLDRAPIIGTLFKNIEETDLNYLLLTSLTTDFSLRSTRTDLTERDLNGNPVPKPSISTLTSTRSYGLGISPFQSLSSSIGLSFESDLHGLSSAEILKGITRGLNPFNGFNDFRFKSAVDTIKGGVTNDSLIFNRDYASRNNFTIAYNPSTFSFISQTISYNSSTASNRVKAPRTIFDQSTAMSRKLQLDATFGLRNFITSTKEPFIGDLSKNKKKKQESAVPVKKSRRDKFKSLNQSGSEQKNDNDSTDTGKSIIKNVTKKVGSLTESLLKTVNDVRFNIAFQNDVQLNGLDRAADPAMRWFGYTTTNGGGFFRNLFTFDLDTVKQFDRGGLSLLGQNQNLFAYSNRKTINYGFAYGFNFGLFTLDLRYDHIESRSFGGNDIREKRSITKSTLFPLLTFLPIPVYDLSLRAMNVGRWPVFNLLSGATDNINFAINYTAKEIQSISEFTVVESNNGFNGIVRNTDDSLKFRSKGKYFQIDVVTKAETFPQLSVDIAWKGGISQGITFSNTNSVSEQKSNTQITNSKSMTSNLVYSKTGFRIPIWFLRKKQLNNRIQLGVAFSYTKQTGYQQSTQADNQGLKPKIKTQDLTLWSVEPKADYSFTKWITGGAFFKYENNKNFTTGTITRTIFGITVNITIGT